MEEESCFQSCWLCSIELGSRCWKLFSGDLESPGTSDATANDLGVRTILPFVVLSLVAERFRQEQALSYRPGFEAKAHESMHREGAQAS